MSRQKKSPLVGKHGNAIVISKRWCLRGLGILLMGYGLAAFVLPLPAIRIPWIIGIGVACLVAAEFTAD